MKFLYFKRCKIELSFNSDSKERVLRVANKIEDKYPGIEVSLFEVSGSIGKVEPVAFVPHDHPFASLGSSGKGKKNDGQEGVRQILEFAEGVIAKEKA